MALVSLGLRWGIFRARLARDTGPLATYTRDVLRKLDQSQLQAMTLRLQIIDLERVLERERRRLAEIEAKRAECEGGG